MDRMIGDLEDKSRQFMWDDCLGTYYLGYLTAGDRPQRLGNGDRGHVLFVYDKPDAYFSEVVRRIQGGSVGYRVPYFGSVG